MQRTLRWDGIIPQNYQGPAPMKPADIQAVKAFIDEHRARTTPFDIVAGGTTPGGNRKRAAKIVRSFVDAGATWWLEGPFSKVRERLKQGPPRVE
jgi:hypothetical protein